MKSFFKAVYGMVRSIPRGKVATYGQIARLAGKPGAARMVGWAMSSSSPKNPIPWHRVVGAGGRIIISKALTYSEIQRQLLQREGVQFHGDRVKMDQFQWQAGLEPKSPRKKRTPKR